MRCIKIVMLILLCGFLYACGHVLYGTHDNIVFVNNSDADIICQELSSPHISKEDTFYVHGVLFGVIPSGQSHSFKSLNEFWEMDFDAIPYVRYLVFDPKSFWEHFYTYKSMDGKARYDMPVLHRYQLTQKDLERLNWTVTYPPTEAMKDVKMYPPYGK